MQHIERCSLKVQGRNPLVSMVTSVFYVLIMTFCVKSQEDILQRGESGRTSKRAYRFKRRSGKKTELNWTEREFVVQDFQMLMGAEILTTAENFEWDRSTPHTIRENLGFVFYFSDQQSWSGSACHLWSESKNVSIECILAVKDDFLYRVSR